MRMRALIRPALILVASLSLALTVLATFPAYQATAAGGFNAANIIDDANFYTSSPTMSVEEIQKFLEVQGANCHTSNGVPCLKDFSQDTRTRPADSLCPKEYKGANGESAATIIWKTSNACNIAPQVLLVTLQKEQSLVTSNTHGWSGYRTAMGYGCPDYSQCSTYYFGFANQVYNAARQFQNYRANSGSFNFASGKTAYIQYNPYKSCGGTNVAIENAATAALYNYTPYQPGGGGNCEAYGNHNFSKFYQAWFGDPHNVKKADPPKEPVKPAADTKAPTGSQRQTAKQEEKPSTSVKPAKNDEKSAKSAKAKDEKEKKSEETKDTEKAPALTLNLEDSDGNALQKDKGVKAESEITVKISNLDAGTKPIVKLDGEVIKTEVEAAKDDKAVVEAVIKAPKKAEWRTVSVLQADKDGKESDAKKAAEARFWVFYDSPTVMKIVKGEDEVKDGVKVNPGQKLAVTVGGFEPEAKPTIGVVHAQDKNEQKLVKDPVANGLGVIEFEVTAPEKLGTYHIVIPGNKGKDGISLAFEVEAKSEVNAPKDESDGDKKADESQASPTKPTPSLKGVTDENGDELQPGTEVMPGATLTIQLGGLIPNETPRVELHSQPIVLPVGKADADGNLKVQFRAPLLPGLHHLKVGKEGGKGELIDAFSFKVKAPDVDKNAVEAQPVVHQQDTTQLAETGSATAPLLALMIMLVGTGFAARSYGRSRQPISVN